MDAVIYYESLELINLIQRIFDYKIVFFESSELLINPFLKSIKWIQRHIEMRNLVNLEIKFFYWYILIKSFSFLRFKLEENDYFSWEKLLELFLSNFFDNWQSKLSFFFV